MPAAPAKVDVRAGPPDVEPPLPRISLDLAAWNVCGVDIEWGTVPLVLESATVNVRNLQADDDRAIVRTAHSALLVENGHRIVVDVGQSRDRRRAAPAIYGWAISILLMQRGEFCLHGAAVTRGGQTIVLTGLSGAGKSTMALALARNGWDLMSDDVTPIAVRSDQPWAVPFSRPVHLYPDAMQAPEIVGGPVFESSLAGRIKNAYRLPQDLAPRPLSAIVELSQHAQEADGVHSERLSRLDAFGAVNAHLHAMDAARTAGRQARLLAWLTGISAVPAFRISRPRGIDSIDAVVASIESLCAELA